MTTADSRTRDDILDAALAARDALAASDPGASGHAEKVAAWHRARNDCLLANQGLIADIATRWMASNPAMAAMGWDDCFQAAQIGFLNCLERYDPARSAIGTYADSWIRQELQRWAAWAWVIRSPASIVRGTEKWTLKLVHIDATRTSARGDDLIMAKLIADDGAERRRQAADIGCDVRDALARLRRESPRVAQVIELWSQGETLDEIGERMGFSRERARQLQGRGFQRLRELLASLRQRR